MKKFRTTFPDPPRVYSTHLGNLNPLMVLLSLSLLVHCSFLQRTNRGSASDQNVRSCCGSTATQSSLLVTRWRALARTAGKSEERVVSSEH